MSKEVFQFITIQNKQLLSVIEKEKQLLDYIDFKKPFVVRIMHDKFLCLIHTIISQKNTSKKIDEIWSRLFFYFKNITPKTISTLSHDQLFSLGINDMQIHLIKNISNDIILKKLNLKKFDKLSSSKIIDILIKYSGLGLWTIQIFLMTSCFKGDIILQNDATADKALRILYPNVEINNDFYKNLAIKLGNDATLFSFCL
jgi:DNA-3-methyladenine glycosylase II